MAMKFRVVAVSVIAILIISVVKFTLYENSTVSDPYVPVAAQRPDKSKKFIFPKTIPSVGKISDVSKDLKAQQPINNVDDNNDDDAFFPELFPLVDMLTEWNTDDVSDETISNANHTSIRRLDWVSQFDLIMKYRDLEIPFVATGIPLQQEAVAKWTDNYLSTQYSKSRQSSVEVAEDNHFIYHSAKGMNVKDWSPPTTRTLMSFDDWAKIAHDKDELSEPEGTYYYFHSNGWKAQRENPWIVDDLSFLAPQPGMLLQDDLSGHKGINCRFGMKGLTAAAHYDGKRNFVAIMRGQKRYILAPPSQCPHLYLYPRSHPSSRHTMIEWSDFDLKEYPDFALAQATQTILKQGEVLYIPSYWFHHIVSLNMNLQCNSRSSQSDVLREDLVECGFYT